ncbi:MAG: NADP-dependent phosphogluconate dehydrogenase, partial [Actinomycetota bacterium]|nr:NADP-dependent phosphogluconate dehydrogenase [Actinomycetota bacterium]
MQLGMIGLGRMGANMVGRLRDAGHEVIGYDVSPGSREVDTLEELVAALQAPRAVWVMVPAGEPTQQTITALGELLEAGDLLVDGGNSRFTDDQVNAAALDGRGIGFVDCGVSGGVWGRENGYGLMAGGSVENVARLQPIFDALRPPVIPGEPGAGYAHAGGVGAGHFAKMVHNGIEYGLMQAYAEGFELLKASEFDLDLREIAGLWNHGSVVRSWL